LVDMLDLTASIVTYKDDPKILAQSINSFLTIDLKVRLIVMDNSPSDDLKDVCGDPRIQYIFNGKNLGFGKAHNLAIKKVWEHSPFHIVLNPDIYFNGPTLKNLRRFMVKNPQVGLVMPKILNPDGTIQYLCKLLPTPVNLIIRRFLKFHKPRVKRNNYKYELRFTSYDQIMDVPFLSGCFMFLRTKALKEVGLFDERLFMYVEDTDLTRSIHRNYRTVFYPKASVYHHYAKGSYKSLRLTFYNMISAIIYFNKYGWFWDREREEINSTIIQNHLN